jgi:hypothetical protein
MHEASRRLLGVLLREVDGFNHREGASSGSSGSGNSSGSDGGGGGASTRSVVIGATNRRQDLDAALLSRFVCGAFVFALAFVSPLFMSHCQHLNAASASPHTHVLTPLSPPVNTGLTCQSTLGCQMSPAERPFWCSTLTT